MLTKLIVVIIHNICKKSNCCAVHVKFAIVIRINYIATKLKKLYTLYANFIG